MGSKIASPPTWRHPAQKEMDMKQFEVSVNGDVFGIFAATSERAALDLFARENGYEDEADMMNRWEHASDLVAVEVVSESLNVDRA